MSPLYIIVQADDDIMTSSCLSPRQHTAYSEWIDNFLAFLTLLEGDTSHSVADDMWKYFCNLWQDRCFRCLAVQHIRSQHCGNTRVVLTPVSVEL